jgi:hypothetical protein
MKTLYLVTLMVGALLPSGTLHAQAQPPKDHHAQMNARGDEAMGFDQAKTTHHFHLYEDGGAIEVTVKDPNDHANLTAIRTHLPHIAQRFAAGDFAIPHFVHDDKVAGTETMTRLRDQIAYKYDDVANGGLVRITTRDPQALAAVHDFLRYQITDHKTGDALNVRRSPE